tara:strand:+ start:1358 stop:1894 length:537 start_codon:yes stop_codon:yes gene_type:complete
MPNNQLQNKTYTVPDKVFNRINQMLKQIKVSDDQTKGFKRAKDIVSDRQVSYSQMNRLKNYFDNYNGDGSDNEFKLIGGKVTRKWIDDSLGQDTESIKKQKKAKMDGGLQNQFIKTHTKDNDNADPTDPNGGLVDFSKGSTMDNIMTGKQVYKSSERKNEAYDKEIQSIKYLIEYMKK